VEVREQPLGLRDSIGDDNDEAGGEAAGERSHDDGIGRAGENTVEQRETMRRDRVDQARERRKAFDRVEQ
jgi:hypothetical protein